MKLTFWLSLSIFILLELGLRAVPFFTQDPLKSFIQEAKRIPFSNTRVYGGLKGGTQILLPKVSKTDLLILGDSIPFGTYVKNRDIFPTRLSQNLQLATVNLSVGSRSPREYNRMLEVGTRYHPRLALYCIFANDFVVSTYTPAPPDETLFLENATISDRWPLVLKQISNLSLSYQLLKFFQQPAAKHHTILWKDEKRSFVFAPKEYWQSQIDWNHPNVKKSFEVNLRYVKEASALAKKEGMALGVVLFPSKEMVFGPLVGEVSAKIFDPSHEETFSNFEKKLEELEVPHVNLIPMLREDARNGKKLFHTIDGHFNEEGHEAIAMHLSPFVRSSLAETKTDQASAEK